MVYGSVTELTGYMSHYKQYMLLRNRYFVGMIISFLISCFSFPFFHVFASSNANLSGISSGVAHYLGQYNPPPLVGCGQYSGHITDYSRFSYDSTNNQMLMFGGGHASTPRDDVDVLNLNAGSSLDWNSAYSSTPVADMIESNFNGTTGAWISTGHPRTRHTWDMMPFIPDTGELTLLYSTGLQSNCEFHPVEGDTFWADHPGLGWAYNPVTKIWRTIPIDPALWGANDLERPSAEYDPVSHKVIILNRSGLYVYDPSNETASKVKSISMGELGIAQNMVYFPPNGKMYYVEDNGDVFEVTLDRNNFANSTIVQVTGVTGTPPSGGETGWAYDSTDQIIGGGINNSTFYSFDPVAKTWTAEAMVSDTVGKVIGTQSFHALDYDPVDDVFVFISLPEGQSIDNQGTWAYRYSGVAISDTTPPTITSVTSSAANGTYGVGSDINVIVNFSEPVTSTGSVTVTLETGATDRSCTFTVGNAASGSCTYTVQVGDASSDLTVNSIAGTIVDQSGNPMTDFYPETNLANNKALVIDTATVISSDPSTPSASKSSSHGNSHKKKKKTVKSFTLSQSAPSVSRGTLFTQRGKKFSKNSTVQVFFETRPGSFGKQILRTDAKGNFSTSFRVNKPAGTYRWYAVDIRTGKTSSSRWYTVR